MIATRLACLVAASLMVLSCTKKTVPDPPTSDPVETPDTEISITHAVEARAAIDKRVRFVGTALRTKLAPSVQGAGLHIYCMNLNEWGEGVENETVEVRGILGRTDAFADTGTPPGPVRQGTGGAIWTLHECTYHLMTVDHD